VNPATIAQIHAVETASATLEPGAREGDRLDLALNPPPPSRSDEDDEARRGALTAWAFAALRFRCPECGRLHVTEDGAEECCPVYVRMVWVNDRGASFETVEDFAAAHPFGIGAGVGVGPNNCPVCGSSSDSPHYATECCLWKDLDAPTRWKIAAAVDLGSTWPEALAPHVGSGA
jgi:hypothetical protein